MATIQLEIKRCNDGCPHCKSHRTIGAGCATDYHCEIMDHVPSASDNPQWTRTDVGRKVSGYVEWDSDYNDVPDWCPLLVKNQLAEPENCYACGSTLRGKELKNAVRDNRERPFCDNLCWDTHRARFTDR